MLSPVLRDGRSVAGAAQGGCGVPYSGDIQDPPGQGPLQPAVGDPAWAGGWTRCPTEVPSNPYHSVILWGPSLRVSWSLPVLGHATKPRTSLRRATRAAVEPGSCWGFAESSSPTRFLVPVDETTGGRGVQGFALSAAFPASPSPRQPEISDPGDLRRVLRRAGAQAAPAQAGGAGAGRLTDAWTRRESS